MTAGGDRTSTIPLLPAQSTAIRLAAAELAAAQREGQKAALRAKLRILDAEDALKSELIAAGADPAHSWELTPDGALVLKEGPP